MLNIIARNRKRIYTNTKENIKAMDKYEKKIKSQKQTQSSEKKRDKEIDKAKENR